MKNRINNTLRIIILCLLFSVFALPLHAQQYLSFGENTLDVKAIEYSKYNFRITPQINIEDQYGFEFFLSFHVKWLDRKDREMEPLDYDDLFIFIIDNNNNLRNFYNTNTLIQEDDRKNKESKPSLTDPSVVFEPAYNFQIGKLQDGFVKNKSQPLKVSFKNYISTKVTMKLWVFFGKIRKDEITIMDNSQIIEWEFYMPEPDIDCRKLVKMFEDSLEENKPAMNMRGIYTIYKNYLKDEPSTESWQGFASSVYDYKGSLDYQKSVLERIQDNPDTALCSGLINIKNRIKTNIKEEEPTINEILDVVLSKIKQPGGGSGGIAGGGASVTDLKQNADDIERYYKAVLEMQMYQVGGPSQTILNSYIDSAKMSNQQHEELMGQVADPSAPGVDYYNQKFNDYYTGFMEITSSGGGEGLQVSSGTSGTSEGQHVSAKGRRLPFWSWIVMGLVAILVAIGVWKFFPFLKKGMRIKGKFK